MRFTEADRGLGLAQVRAKACWVAGQYAGIPFREGRGQGATFMALFQHVAQALRDAELPVRPVSQCDLT